MHLSTPKPPYHTSFLYSNARKQPEKQLHWPGRVYVFALRPGCKEANLPPVPRSNCPPGTLALPGIWRRTHLWLSGH